MHKHRYLLSIPAALLVGLAGVTISNQGIMHSASLPHRPAAPTGPQHFVATAGYGGDDWAANIYSPQKINIYAGDSVTWTNRGRLEPHTISFGSMPLLRKLAQQLVQVAPQKAGPPQLSFNSQAAFPTRAATYDGTGFANSGLLQQGQRWTIRFTRPGTYKYHCLIHFPGMTGTVVVHPRPAGSRSYTVLTGYGSGNSAADVFFPDTLTVHVGSTVTWKHAFFHTVTFASVNTIRRLRKEFIVPVPQKGGPPKLTINPAVAFPAGGTVESGIPMLSSGILQPPHSKFSVTFTKPGVYHYACLVHFGMDGTIRVIK